MGRLLIARDEYDLELLIGAIRRRRDSNERNVELVLRWDPDTLVRKLSTKMREKWWNDYSTRNIFRRKLRKQALEDTLRIQEAAINELVGEFLEECESTKIP